jgi:hypothetical protein
MSEIVGRVHLATRIGLPSLPTHLAEAFRTAERAGLAVERLPALTTLELAGRRDLLEAERPSVLVIDLLGDLDQGRSPEDVRTTLDEVARRVADNPNLALLVLEFFPYAETQAMRTSLWAFDAMLMRASAAAGLTIAHVGAGLREIGAEAAQCDYRCQSEIATRSMAREIASAIEFSGFMDVLADFDDPR